MPRKTSPSHRSYWARAALFALLPAGLARADELPAGADRLPSLLSKLSAWSARFESMLGRAVFTMSGHTEEIDGDGHASDRKEGVFRVNARGTRAHFEVVRYTEDGEDKTAEAREKVRKDELDRDKKAKDPDEELHMPFLASELSKYTFRIGEADPLSPVRVRIYFTSKRPAKNLGNGSAWVDTRTGDVLSMGVSPSRTSMFVDYLNVTLEFAEPTPMGPGVSRLTFEARGGFLFIHKHVRGVATFSSYDVR